MTLRQKLPGYLFALGIGLTLAWFVYQRTMDPQPTLQRQAEEAVVLAARDQLLSVLGLAPGAEVVDPLAPNRVAGKVYVYPRENGWEVSGFYRRAPETEWLPWLMHLDERRSLTSLRLSQADPEAERLTADPRVALQ